jgi:adenylate cyclase
MLPLDEAQRGITGYYVVARSLDEALAPLYSLQRILFLVGIGAVILAVFISAGLTARINRPVQLLIEGIKRIEEGDYSEQVPIITRDELSTLTHTFNSLVINLRERLLMLKFVSKATLEAIQKNLSSVEPGGTRKEVTVFFSDIRGFTSWSEKKAPEVVIDMLNRCLHMQADLVKECGGDVDKFVGDELVAVFEGEKKEANAVEAAIRIQHEMVKLIQDVKDIHVGIGINTGEVVMGAVGSRDRMDYTVIGNHVNLGARLCSAAAKGQILISQSVFEHLERRIETKNLEPIRVKGIENPVPIYEIVWNGGTV